MAIGGVAGGLLYESYTESKQNGVENGTGGVIPRRVVVSNEKKKKKKMKKKWKEKMMTDAGIEPAISWFVVKRLAIGPAGRAIGKFLLI